MIEYVFKNLMILLLLQFLVCSFHTQFLFIKKIYFSEVERDDAGKYSINVANDSGSCNVPLKVKVIAPPLPPTGPLGISNVSKDRATLSWKPPQDDGGSKVAGYVVERRDTSRGSDAWVPVTQNCKDTTFTVPSLLDGHEYEFRVMAFNENGTSEPLRSSAPTIAQLPFSMLTNFNLNKKFRCFFSLL